MAEEQPQTSERNFVSFKIGNDTFYGERINNDDVNGIKYLKEGKLEWIEKENIKSEVSTVDEEKVKEYINICDKNSDRCKDLEQKTDETENKDDDEEVDKGEGGNEAEEGEKVDKAEETTVTKSEEGGNEAEEKLNPRLPENPKSINQSQKNVAGEKNPKEQFIKYPKKNSEQTNDDDDEKKKEALKKKRS